MRADPGRGALLIVTVAVLLTLEAHPAPHRGACPTLRRGISLLRGGHPGRASKTLEAGWEDARCDRRGLRAYNLGVSHARLGREAESSREAVDHLEEARREFTGVLDADPDDDDALHNRELVQRWLDRLASDTGRGAAAGEDAGSSAPVRRGVGDGNPGAASGAGRGSLAAGDSGTAGAAEAGAGTVPSGGASSRRSGRRAARLLRRAVSRDGRLRAAILRRVLSASSTPGDRW